MPQKIFFSSASSYLSSHRGRRRSQQQQEGGGGGGGVLTSTSFSPPLLPLFAVSQSVVLSLLYSSTFPETSSLRSSSGSFLSSGVPQCNIAAVKARLCARCPEQQPPQQQQQQQQQMIVMIVMMVMMVMMEADKGEDILLGGIGKRRTRGQSKVNHAV